jgi:hypothetical protein
MYNNYKITIVFAVDALILGRRDKVIDKKNVSFYIKIEEKKYELIQKKT